MGCNPQLPRLLVYQHLKHLGSHDTRKPLEASLNAVTSSTPAGFMGREGMDQAGSLAAPWWGGGACGWEIAKLGSANSAHPAVIFNWEAWRVGRWVFRATPATAPGY